MKELRRRTFAKLQAQPLAKAAELRREQSGTRDPATGSNAKTRVGQVARVLLLPFAGKGEALHPVLQEGDRKYLLALDETRLAYDAAWTETERSEQAPFEPIEGDYLVVDGQSMKLVAQPNPQDLGAGGLWEVFAR